MIFAFVMACAIETGECVAHPPEPVGSLEACEARAGEMRQRAVALATTLSFASGGPVRWATFCEPLDRLRQVAPWAIGPERDA